MTRSLQRFTKDYFTNNGFKLLVSKKLIICFKHPERIDPASYIATYEDWARRLYPGQQFHITIDPLKNKFCVFILPSSDVKHP